MRWPKVSIGLSYTEISETPDGAGHRVCDLLVQLVQYRLDGHGFPHGSGPPRCVGNRPPTEICPARVLSMNVANCDNGPSRRHRP